MGTIFQSLDSDLQKFIREQRVFFIASTSSRRAPPRRPAPTQRHLTNT